MYHGRWEQIAGSKQLPHRPTIYAIFSHSSTSAHISLPFIIDTGADQTFIVPDHQELLGIPKDCRMFETQPVETIVGKVKFNLLTDCRLTFTNNNGRNFDIDRLTVYFARQVKRKFWQFFKKNTKPMYDINNYYPSILGRDVLRHFCMGYCNPSEYLFISQRHNEYLNCLKTDFPKLTPPPQQWGGTYFDIADDAKDME